MGSPDLPSVVEYTPSTNQPWTNDYWPVQDLRAVNQLTITSHSYTLLGLIPIEDPFFICLDLMMPFYVST